MAVTTIDFAPLTAEPSPEEVAAYKARAKADGVQWSSWQNQQLIGILIAVPVVLVMMSIAISAASSLLGSGIRSGSSGFAIVSVVTFLLPLGIIVAAVIWGVSWLRSRWRLWARMDAFARANGLLFSPYGSDPGYPGAVFTIGRARQRVDHLQNVEGRPFDLGTFRFTTGSGKSRSVHNWGYLAFKLDRRLPHMVLDSQANNGIFGTNLPATFDRSQRLSLEGDFDRYFTLYCPREYERDALYVFTPDLMALLIDEAAPFDVEIVDDWMFVYSTRALPTGDPAIYARLFRIMDTVGGKTLRQPVRYSDERIGDFAANIVAPHGTRLKRSVSVGAIVVGALAIALWLWSLGGGLLERLLR